MQMMKGAVGEGDVSMTSFYADDEKGRGREMCQWPHFMQMVKRGGGGRPVNDLIFMQMITRLLTSINIPAV